MFKVFACGFVTIVLGCSCILRAQSSLTLASSTATAGSTVPLNLSLSSPTGGEPAALQWTLSYPTASVTGVSVAAGASVTAAGKSVSCASGTGTYTCIVSGLNANIIADGVVAVISVTLSATASTIPIGVSNAAGASLVGVAIPVSATGSTITIPQPVALTVSSLACSPASMAPGGSSTCQLSLSGAAGSGGVMVALNSGSSSLSMPTSVTVPAGSNAASFTSTAGSFSSNQSAVITASLNGSSATASIALNAPVLVTSLQCAASSLAPNANTSCTVTLSQAAPAAGISVALTDTATALTAPTTVAVAASATSASFTVSTKSISTNQTATLTATLNGSSASGFDCAERPGAGHLPAVRRLQPRAEREHLLHNYPFPGGSRRRHFRGPDRYGDGTDSADDRRGGGERDFGQLHCKHEEYLHESDRYAYGNLERVLGDGFDCAERSGAGHLPAVRRLQPRAECEHLLHRYALPGGSGRRHFRGPDRYGDGTDSADDRRGGGERDFGQLHCKHEEYLHESDRHAYGNLERVLGDGFDCAERSGAGHLPAVRRLQPRAECEHLLHNYAFPGGSRRPAFPWP